jgi:hypothetical protein
MKQVISVVTRAGRQILPGSLSLPGVAMTILRSCFLVVLLLGVSSAQQPTQESTPPPPSQEHPPEQTQNTRPAVIGSINYVEGEASIEGQPLSPQSVGSVALQGGQVLTTQSGRVEILLTPGVFFRVDHNSAVKMVSPDLADTKVELQSGRAMVEVANISKDNNIRIEMDDTSTQLLKKGLYDFDASQNQVRVFKGKAALYAPGHKKVGIGDEQEVTLNTGGKLKTKSFDKRQYADSLYRWSGLRSGYLAEEDADAAAYYVNGGPGWFGAGWYWDPWFDGWTFIPATGVFYSPFGWGFYSPFAVWGSPFFYGGGWWGGGWYGHPYGHPHHFGDVHPPYGHGFEPRGGFHGGGFGGGGFHGGGGGGRR